MARKVESSFGANELTYLKGFENFEMLDNHRPLEGGNGKFLSENVSSIDLFSMLELPPS
jgi:hypothetical protein